MPDKEFEINDYRDQPTIPPSTLDGASPPAASAEQSADDQKQGDPTLPFKASPPPAAVSDLPTVKHRSAPGTTVPFETEFGDYEVIEEIGRGGMGVVYRAKQKKLNRIVALKLIIGGRMASREDLQRFLVEAKSAARLQHRHIVTVHEIGEVDGQHYFSMELIEGDTLANRLRDGPLPSKQAARYIEIVARALHYAHSAGILHRDLKPSNIMVDANDEPYVTDFGLAKRIGGDATHRTVTGAILGTPSYMSPEQAAGKVKDINAACDIYGLGAVLYELVTGRAPFRSETHLDTLMHVMHSEPVPPRLLNPKVDADLETICLKCLEKDPKNRYASCEELAQDLQRYLQGDTISARSSNMLDRLGRILDRSQHDVAFHTWSTLCLLIALIVFAEHLVVFLLAMADQPSYLFFIARVSQFVLLAIIFWNHRGDSLLPRTSAERELWTIWIGYLVAYGAGYVVVRIMISGQIIGPGANAPQQWDNLVLYPISSILSGLAFFVMGSNYWGRCYAFGLAFMIVAVISTLHLWLSPLEFGVLWGLALTSLGIRLHQLGDKAKEEKRNLLTEEALLEEVSVGSNE